MAVFGLIAERHQLQSDEFVTWGALGVMVSICLANLQGSQRRLTANNSS